MSVSTFYLLIMSQDQINQILKRLDQQDIVLLSIKKELKEMEPIKTAFNNVMGFDQVSMWILKFLVSLGAGIGVLYALVKWLKQ